MKLSIDRVAWVLAAIVTFLVSILPCWFAYLAMEAGVAPTWPWGVVAALCAVGVFMSLLFLRRAVVGNPLFGTKTPK